ncbi:Imm21 family immunity protein [Streptomyces sp. NPDC058855]|uniref:Imm21 family immunity protein n=1 Tax=Streptomyces sp. NPDC058855 TaxID=3346651 RepID=UPI003681F94D
MKWLETDFGLYALCPDSYVSAWAGTEADAVAAEPTGRVGLPDHGDVLTFGGEPLPVTYLPQVMTFVRWVAAEDDEGLESAVQTAQQSSEWQDLFEVSLEGRYTLMDSGVTGDDVEEEDVIHVEVPKGTYRVQSLTIIPDDESEFQLDRLVPVSS